MEKFGTLVDLEPHYFAIPISPRGTSLAVGIDVMLICVSIGMECLRRGASNKLQKIDVLLQELPSIMIQPFEPTTLHPQSNPCIYQ